MKTSTGVIMGVLAAGAVAGTVYMLEGKSTRKAKKKIKKAVGRTVKNAEYMLNDLAMMIK